MRPAVLLALALLGPALLAAPAAGQPQDNGQDTVGWSVRPAEPGREALRYQAVPGQVLEDAVLVTNHGEAPLELAVATSDATLAADGGVSLAPAGAAPVGLGAWLRPEQERLDLGPGETRTLAFRLEVPADAAAGPHAGALVTSSRSGHGGVAVDRRFAASIVVEVAEALAASPAGEGGGVPGWAWAGLGVLALAAALTWLGVLRARG